MARNAMSPNWYLKPGKFRCYSCGSAGASTIGQDTNYYCDDDCELDQMERIATAEIEGKPMPQNPTDEPLQPLKVQTDASNSGFLIYSKSTAIFLEIMEDEQPDIVSDLRDATGMIDALQRKFFLGTVNNEGQLILGEEITEEEYDG